MAGKYFSHRWIRQNVLQQSDDDVALEDQYIMLEMQSGDPRWTNPIVLQNEQMMQQQQEMMQPQQQDDQQPDGEDEKTKEVRDAMVFVDRMKKRGGPSERTTQEQSKYKSAVQLIAKNPEIVERIGSKQ